MLGHAPAEQQVAPLLLGGLARADEGHVLSLIDLTVPILHQHAAHDPLHVPASAGVAVLLASENADVLLAGQDLEGFVGVAGGPENFDEELGEQPGQVVIDCTIDRDDSAESRDRVAGQSFFRQPRPSLPPLLRRDCCA